MLSISQTNKIFEKFIKLVISIKFYSGDFNILWKLNCNFSFQGKIYFSFLSEQWMKGMRGRRECQLNLFQILFFSVFVLSFYSKTLIYSWTISTISVSAFLSLPLSLLLLLSIAFLAIVGSFVHFRLQRPFFPSLALQLTDWQSGWLTDWRHDSLAWLKKNDGGTAMPFNNSSKYQQWIIEKFCYIWEAIFQMCNRNFFSFGFCCNFTPSYRSVFRAILFFSVCYL